MSRKQNHYLWTLLQISLMLLTLVLLNKTTIYASDIQLSIKLDYTISEGNYLQGDPLLIAVLKSGEKSYFARLRYNGNYSFAKLNVEKGNYSVYYYTAKPGRENTCDKKLLKGSLPDSSDLMEVRQNNGNQLRSLFGGGVLSLISAPVSITVKKESVLKLKAKSLDDSFIPAMYIDTTEKINKNDRFSVILYISDKNGKKVKRISKKTDLKAKRGYYLDYIINTYPGHYYYLMVLDAPGKYSCDSNVLLDTYVGYSGEKLSVKRVDIIKGNKRRSILVDTDSNNNMVITLKDPDSNNVEYLVYSSKEKYPTPHKDGSYDGTPIKMKKSGNIFTITMKPAVYNKQNSYNIVKRINGTINHNFHINIVYSWSTAYKDGHLSTRWRVRPRAGFTVATK